MAKQQVTKKNTQFSHTNGKGLQQEQTEIFDDNLLPEATEIKLLFEIDPNILDWLKARAEKEQDFRHKHYEERTNIIKTTLNKEVVTNRIGLSFAFIIILTGMAFSSYLISLNHFIAGTIFSGLTLTYTAALFLRIPKKEVLKKD